MKLRQAKCQVRNEAPNLPPSVLFGHCYRTPRGAVIDECGAMVE
jgi:hypothetical protein